MSTIFSSFKSKKPIEKFIISEREKENEMRERQTDRERGHKNRQTDRRERDRLTDIKRE